MTAYQKLRIHMKLAHKLNIPRNYPPKILINTHSKIHFERTKTERILVELFDLIGG